MTPKLIFAPGVPDDLLVALEYYDSISPELANRFRANVNRRLRDIAVEPEIFPFDVPPIRFARIAQFPYLIFFVDKPTFVSVLAVLHGSSDPDKWRQRPHH